VFISPRLNQILRILLGKSQPVSVDALAQATGVSRRTVFRELDHVDQVLQKTGLRLDTVPGEGMRLTGPEAGRAALSALLGGASAMSPQNKQDRRQLLLLLLTDADGLQKLYYFAQTLGVSEATVSTDLDGLEEYCAVFGLRLARRQSQGVELTGGERALRRLAVDVVCRIPDVRSFSANYGYPSLRVMDEVQKTLQGEWAPKLDWMTEESLAMLTLQLTVMVERVRRGHTLEQGETPAAAGLPRQLAGQLCDSLESRFSVSLPDGERSEVALFIRACRAKHLNPLDINDAAVYRQMQNMACRMIDAFDPRLSPCLKLNEDLIQGLSLHLWSAVVRLRQGIELKSAMHDQLVRDFPEVFAKSRQAARVIEQEYGVRVPDSEIAFIASHFGAALMHYGERSSHRMVLKTGVVCVAGIGVSYMMASQVRRRFRGQLDVAVSDSGNPDEWAGFDLLISTIPLERAPCPVILVRPVLEQEDYAAIRAAMDARSAAPEAELPPLTGPLPQLLERTASYFLDMSAMLRSFTRQTVRADCTFDELARLAAYRFGSEQTGGIVAADLLRREAVSTQVIERLEIVLLHARTEGVQRPVIGLISPEGERFTDGHFLGARGCFLMLAPASGDRGLLEVFGSISGALIEDEVLLTAVQNGDEAVAYTRVEAAILQHLKDYWNDKLSG